jgi:hypothetical protein
MPKLLFMLEKLCKQTESEKMEISLFALLYDEFLKLFIHFGAATRLAFSGKQVSIITLFYNRYYFKSGHHASQLSIDGKIE